MGSSGSMSVKKVAGMFNFNGDVADKLRVIEVFEDSVNFICLMQRHVTMGFEKQVSEVCCRVVLIV